MTMLRGAVAGLMIAAVTAMPALASGENGVTRLWGLGQTGWMCTMAPCPWQGVFPIAETGERGRPLNIETMRVPPPMRGDAEQIRLVAETFDDGRCIVVRGRFDGALLEIADIVGPC